MKSKILSAALITAVLSSFAFGANDKAIELSNKIFATKKDASAKELVIRDACFKIHNEMLEVTKNMTPEQRDDFNKEFKMQMRKNMATLGKDEYFNPAVCRSVMKKQNKNYGMKSSGERNPGMGMGGYNCQSNADCPYNK